MTEPIASLDMYCWPEERAGWEALWSAMRMELSKVGVQAPDALSFDRPIEDIWQDPNLLIGHCCGWPYISRLRHKVSLIGRFDFGVEGCQPGYYNSVFIVPENSPASSLSDIANQTTRIAVNGTNSQSGFRVLAELFAPTNTLISGSHRASIQAVANGNAELAAIDAVTWELAKAYEPAAKKVRLLGSSIPRPGLPLITAKSNDALKQELFDAVQNAIAIAGQPLGISSFLEAHETDYEVLL